jgi:hypothetical protein
MDMHIAEINVGGKPAICIRRVSSTRQGTCGGFRVYGILSHSG